jgi:Rrf2 family protein
VLRVNKKIEYGIIALLYLNNKEDKVASVREISAFSKTPETLLSKVMQSMKNAGMVAAVYGNHGGYRLNRELSEINLLNLTEVLAGPVQVAECLEPGNETCPVKTGCTIVEPMHLLNQKIIHLFQETSLESLSRKRANS